MGRGGGGAGGGFSGGGHSGGSFGGGHNSGGFSGGGRGSSGGFGGGFSGGGPNHGNNFGNRRPGGPPPGGRYTPPPPGFYGGWRRSGRRSRAGCGTPVLVVVILLAVVLICWGSLNIAVPSESGVPSSTKQREALSGQVKLTEWYSDEIGWVSSPNVLREGLEAFYQQTGVQPYVLLVSYEETLWNSDGTLNPTAATDYLEQFYAETFTDEAHFLFAYFQCENDARDVMDGEFRYLSGYSADTIMDSEAIDILWGYFEAYYNDLSYSMEEMFSETFKDTAENIMSKPTNGWDVAKVLIIAAAVIAVLVLLYWMLKNRNKRQKEKAEETQKILNTPLDTFGNDTSDLEDKYK